MKKLLALILALMMAVCVFSACSEKEEADKEPAKTEEPAKKEPAKEPAEEPEEETSSNDKDVTAAVTKFSSYYFSGNDKALDYVDKNSTSYTELETGLNEYLTLTGSFSDLVDEMGVPEEYSEDVEKLFTDFADDITALVDTEIITIEADDHEATVKCEIKMPNQENFESELESLDVEEIIANNFTEEELNKIATDGEEAQVEFALKFMKILFDEMVTVAENNLTTQSATAKLEKINGNWLITSFE